MQSSSLLQALLLSIYVIHGVNALPATSKIPKIPIPVPKSAPQTSNLSIPIVWGGKGSLPRIALPIGSNGTTFQMVADTGSDSFWVLSQSAAKAPGHGLGSNSTTFTDIPNSNWTAVYGGDGALKINGTIAQDSVTFANQTFRNMSVGVVSTPGGFTKIPYFAVPYDGIFGFSPGTGPSADMNATTPFREMVANKTIPAVTGWKYPTTTTVGQITLGWVNASNSQPGTQVEVRNEDDDFWAVNITSIKVGNTTVGGAKSAPITAMLDTGTVALVVPKGESGALLQSIPGYKNIRDKITIPCTATADVAFEIGNRSLVVRGPDFVGAPVSSGSAKCASAVKEDATLPAAHWILGSSILHNWHVVYNQTSGNITIAQANQ